MKKLFLTTLGLMALVFGFAAVQSEAGDMAINIAISPSTLNIGSQGIWVTVHADIPYYTVQGATVTLNGIEVVSTFADDRGDLVAKFNIDDVKAIVQPGTADLTLSGFTKEGDVFSGTSAVRVVNIIPKK